MTVAVGTTAAGRRRGRTLGCQRVHTLRGSYPLAHQSPLQPVERRLHLVQLGGGGFGQRRGRPRQFSRRLSRGAGRRERRVQLLRKSGALLGHQRRKVRCTLLMQRLLRPQLRLHGANLLLQTRDHEAHLSFASVAGLEVGAVALDGDRQLARLLLACSQPATQQLLGSGDVGALPPATNRSRLAAGGEALCGEALCGCLSPGHHTGEPPAAEGRQHPADAEPPLPSPHCSPLDRPLLAVLSPRSPALGAIVHDELSNNSALQLLNESSRVRVFVHHINVGMRD